MLDAQLCPIYANVAAQDLLAFSLNKARGRPFSDLLHDQRAARLAAAPLARYAARASPTASSWCARVSAARVAYARCDNDAARRQITGTHLLLELADTTQRQRISRENDLLARLDGSRLMVRQLAHEIKNPSGGLRGAAQLLERELHDAGLKEYTRRHHRRGRPAHRAGRLHGSARRVPPTKSLLNVHEICEHVYHLLRARGAADAPHRARLRPEPAERHAGPQPADPGTAQRGAQRDAGAG